MSEQNNAPQAPAEEPNSFEAEFQAFLGHTFDDPPEEEEEAPPSGEETTPAPAADSTVPSGESNDTITAPAAPSAETPAGGNAADAVQPDPEIDPADLAAMLGMADAPAPAAQPAPTGTPPAAETSAPAAPAATAEDEPFMPFTPTFKLAPEMMSALFESEDAETRHTALVGLLSNFGNAITAVVDKRVAEREAAFAARFRSSYQQEQAGQAIYNHFYGEHQDLLPYKPAVKKAFELVAKKHGADKPYTPELATEVAKLARAALKASGIALPAKAAPAAPASPKKAPPSKAPGNGFDATASRPAAASPDDNSPASLVGELSEW